MEEGYDSLFGVYCNDEWEEYFQLLPRKIGNQWHYFEKLYRRKEYTIMGTIYRYGTLMVVMKFPSKSPLNSIMERIANDL